MRVTTEASQNAPELACRDHRFVKQYSPRALTSCSNRDIAAPPSATSFARRAYRKDHSRTTSSRKKPSASNSLIRYFAMVQQNITKTLRNDSLKPLHRLREWFDIQFDFFKQPDFRNGCLIGNFSAEVGPHSDMINAKLIEMYAEIYGSVVYCLKAAVKSGELPAT